MRESLLIILVASTLVFSGCQARENYVVINQTDNPITVEYKIKGTGGASAPGKLTLKEFESANFEWRLLKPGEYELDTTTGTVKVNVAAYEALSIGKSYPDGENDQAKIDSIRIDGGQGSIFLDGQQLPRHFKPEVKHKYVFRYR